MTDDPRCRRLNDRAVQPGRYVLYWMQQSQRASFNPALEHAIDVANREGLPVRPVFGKVRYMYAKGLERKFDMTAYLGAVDRLVEAGRR